MPQTRSTQVQTPTNSDAFNLTADLATMAESIPGIVTVANDAAGDTVATNRAASGFAISDSRPLFVYNLATKTIRVKDSAGWRDMNGPLGMVFINKVSTASGAVGALSVINNISSFTFVGGRNYRIVWDPSYLVAPDTGGLFYCAIGTCATTDGAAVTTGITVINGRTKGGIVGGSMTQHSGAITAIYEPASTSTLQIKFTAQRVVGSTQTIQFLGNGVGETCDYIIYDDGAVI